MNSLIQVCSDPASSENAQANDFLASILSIQSPIQSMTVRPGLMSGSNQRDLMSHYYPTSDAGAVERTPMTAETLSILNRGIPNAHPVYAEDPSYAMPSFDHGGRGHLMMPSNVSFPLSADETHSLDNAFNGWSSLDFSRFLHQSYPSPGAMGVLDEVLPTAPQNTHVLPSTMDGFPISHTVWPTTTSTRASLGSPLEQVFTPPAQSLSPSRPSTSNNRPTTGGTGKQLSPRRGRPGSNHMNGVAGPEKSRRVTDYSIIDSPPRRCRRRRNNNRERTLDGPTVEAEMARQAIFQSSIRYNIIASVPHDNKAAEDEKSSLLKVTLKPSDTDIVLLSLSKMFVHSLRLPLREETLGQRLYDAHDPSDVSFVFSVCSDFSKNKGCRYGSYCEKIHLRIRDVLAAANREAAVEKNIANLALNDRGRRPVHRHKAKQGQLDLPEIMVVDFHFNNRVIYKPIPYRMHLQPPPEIVAEAEKRVDGSRPIVYDSTRSAPPETLFVSPLTTNPHIVWDRKRHGILAAVVRDRNLHFCPLDKMHVTNGSKLFLGDDGSVELRPQLCSHFARGFCPRGAQCCFIHALVKAGSLDRNEGDGSADGESSTRNASFSGNSRQKH